MNNDQKDDRIRPGMLIVMGAVVAAVLIPVWVVATKSEPAVPSVTAQASTRAKPSRTVTPAEQAAAAEADEPAPATAMVSHPVMLAAPAPVRPPPQPADPAQPIPRGPLEDQWGIQIVSVTAPDASVVEMLYKVVVPEKAAALSDGKTGSYLLDRASGATTVLCPPDLKEWPFSAHSRARSRAHMMWQAGGFPPPPSRLIPGKTYSLLIPNVGGAIKHGSLVAIVIGNCQTDNITVE